MNGCSVVSSIKNIPWRGTFDAIVTDPPYSLRTALLNGGKVQGPFTSDSGSNIPESSEMCNTENFVENGNENNIEDRISSISTLNTTSPIADNDGSTLPLSDYPDCSVLEDLISFADDHLVCQGRLVFWWPEGTYMCTYIFFIGYYFSCVQCSVFILWCVGNRIYLCG